MRYLSLFSGIEAASVAWQPLGWECVGVAEIEPFPCAVLAHHYPDVPNLGSVTDITDDRIAALGPIDLVVGGSPCQDLSVAGKRAGLAGARSGLFHEQLRIFHAARSLCGARWLLWENVPGAFSSHAGRDFAVVVGAMAGCELGVPPLGWGNEGAAVGPNGLVEWSSLDAQWFGVAQRRRRVFALLDTGDWTHRPPVLLEPESLRGDSPPRREAGEGVVGTLEASLGRRGGQPNDHDPAGGLIAAPHDDISPALKARDSKGPSSDGDGDGDGAILVPMVAHSLRAEGFDASEDGTGRGTPLVPVAFDTTQVTSKANRSDPKPGDPCHPLAAGAHPPAVAFSCKDHGADAGDIAPTLRAMGHNGSHANAGGQLAVAFHGSQDPDVSGDVTHPVGRNQGQETCVSQGAAVRRLTPRECERLQGFPDDYTLIPLKKRRKVEADEFAYLRRTYPSMPMEDARRLACDGPRYKALGNSFAEPVIRWIGRKIQEVVLET